MPSACAKIGRGGRTGPGGLLWRRQQGLRAGYEDRVSLLRRSLALSVGRRWPRLILVSVFAISLPIPGRQWPRP
jgi:hypothetical protein